jgi:transcriptional regulator with XRE-family HTH domain
MQTVIISAQLKAWRRVDDANDGRGDFTQSDAAARLGVPLKTYIDWEQGRHGPRGLALATVAQRIDLNLGSGKKNPAGASLPSNRKETRPKAQLPSPTAIGARAKRVTHAKKQTRKKSGNA